MSTETYATSAGSNGSTSPAGTAGALPPGTRRRPGSVPKPGAQRTGPVAWSATEAHTPPKIAAQPEPRLRQLIGVCGWAAVLGGIGLVVGFRGFFGVLAGDPPKWYEPTMMIFGAVGIGFTVIGYLTVHRSRVPWISLALASLVLGASMVATSIAF